MSRKRQQGSLAANRAQSTGSRAWGQAMVAMALTGLLVGIGCGAAPKAATPAAPEQTPGGTGVVQPRPTGGEGGSGTRSFTVPGEPKTEPEPGDTTTLPPTTATGVAPSPTQTSVGEAGDAMRLIEEEEHIMLGALDEAKKAGGLSSSSGGTPCSRACASLATMRRGVAQRCGLSASSDRSCPEAKARLTKNEEQAKQARCECAP
jgi:hypothetical protein